MSGFIAIAGLLTLAVLVALLYPLLRRRVGSPEAWRSGGLAALLIALGAAGLYPLWSNFKWNAPAPALDSPEAMVGRLARRLEKQPDDLAGWLQLGRSYAVLAEAEHAAEDEARAKGHWSLAVHAYERANTLSKGQSAEAALGLGEALYNAGRSELSGRSGRLIEQALALDPNSPRAVLYGALVASERNDIPLAKQRFQRLLDANPPDDVRKMLEQQIQALDATARMAKGGAAAKGAAGTGAAKAAAVTIPLHITLSRAVAAKAKSGAPLFVQARIPGQPGPPLAALRLDASFPQDVDLHSTDTMIPGADGFSAGQELEVEAHIYNAGGAHSSTGDPFGTVRVKAGQGSRVKLEISQLKP
ncbi:MAG TPA: hypothetical protein VMH77_06005 [Steroidobacteraceae bacterium]|nr:hypothetical protein [Steroidobacteraceae bacterium]